MRERHVSGSEGFQEHGDLQLLAIQTATVLTGVLVSVGANNRHAGQGCLAKGLVLRS